MITITVHDNTLGFAVYVQPRSSRASIVGIHQDALKIKLTAPPVGGAANKQCLQLLAKALGIPKSSLTIDSGQTSRHKQIRIRPGPGKWTLQEQCEVQKKIRQLAGESNKTA